MSTNDITGDALVSRPSSDLYRDNYDRIFGKPEKQPEPLGPDPVLCRFYQVETFPDLVEAMQRHIEKLQAKVPPIGNNWPGKVREG